MRVFFLALQGRKLPNVYVWDTGKRNHNLFCFEKSYSKFKLLVTWQEKAKAEKATKTSDLNFMKVVEGT